MRRFLVISALLVLISSCGETMPDGPLSKIRLADESQNATLQKRLKLKHIFFKVERDGYIFYSQQDTKIVLQLSHEIFCENREPAIWFGGDHAKEKLFLDALDKIAVSYEFKVENGQKWIKWKSPDDEKVNEVINKQQLFGANNQNPC